MGHDCSCRAGNRAAAGRKPHRWTPKVSFLLTVRWPGHVLEVWYTPRRGYHPYRLLRAEGGAEHAIAHFPRLDFRKMKKRKIGEGAGTTASHLAAMETTLFDKHPNIVKHLALTKYEDGSPRTPGKMMLGTLGTAYVVTWKEPDAFAELPVTAANLDDAFALSDLLLGSDDAPWQVDKFAMQRAPKQKK